MPRADDADAALPPPFVIADILLIMPPRRCLRLAAMPLFAEAYCRRHAAMLPPLPMPRCDIFFIADARLTPLFSITLLFRAMPPFSLLSL